MYDIKFTNITNDEKVNMNIIHDSLEIKSENFGLNEKVKNAILIKFKFDEILKFTIRIYSSLSNIKNYYYLNLQIVIMHRQFFKILSQNPESLKTQSNDLNDPLNFAFLNWMNKQWFQSSFSKTFSTLYYNFFKPKTFYSQLFLNSSISPKMVIDRVQIFNVNEFFKGLSNDISHFVVA